MQTGSHRLGEMRQASRARAFQYASTPCPNIRSKNPAIPRTPNRDVATGRYRHLYRDILIPRNEVSPLVIAEANLAIEDPEERAIYFLDKTAWYDDRPREDDYIIEMTLFTLGGLSGWDAFDVMEFLPDLAARVIALKDE